MDLSTAPTFTVLLPTYKRPELVLRSIRSVFAQTLHDWQLLVINDSPEEDYSEAETLIEGTKNVIYLRNPVNSGKNYSLNTALNYLENTSFKGYIVFLDDDDWLDPGCLENFKRNITEIIPWIVSNRTNEEKSLTKNSTGREVINYYKDCLISKRFKGDATHCIYFDGVANCRFPESIKNGEEWFYFSQVANQFQDFLYIPVTGTYSAGYLSDGLTRTVVNRNQKFVLYRTLFRELSKKHLLNVFTFFYMFLRLGKIFL